MKRVSKISIITKWVFPIFLFGLLTLVTLGALASGEAKMIAIVMPVFMMLIAFFLIRKPVWDLADEVWDAEDHLLIKKGDKEQKVYLTDIVNVNYTALSTPPRVTIMCRTPGPFGTEVAFTAPTTFNPFTTHPYVKGLIQRVDALRKP